MWKTSAFLFLGFSLTACSSGSGGGAGTSSGAVSCESFCDKGLALSCATKTREECIASCESDATERGECADEFLSSGACLVDSFGCDLQTASGTDIMAACPNETVAYSACRACVPAADDDSCDSCSKTNCCTERKDAYGDAEVLQASVCLVDCLDAAGVDCENTCFTPHPNATAKLTALATCTSNACPGC